MRHRRFRAWQRHRHLGARPLAGGGKAARRPDMCPHHAMAAPVKHPAHTVGRDRAATVSAAIQQKTSRTTGRHPTRGRAGTALLLVLLSLIIAVAAGACAGKAKSPNGGASTLSPSPARRPSLSPRTSSSSSPVPSTSPRPSLSPRTSSSSSPVPSTSPSPSAVTLYPAPRRRANTSATEAYLRPSRTGWTERPAWSASSSASTSPTAWYSYLGRSRPELSAPRLKTSLSASRASRR